ncbi:MAG TPA: CBS domain-containing protein [Acidimicrobiales bacterium]|nr:CBS domain-containing protein [Acidimicrobiales bacterium]
MDQLIEDVMTSFPKVIDADRPLTEAAAVMRDADVGDVIVLAGGTLHGILTDRDIAVRAVAAGRVPSETSVRDICTTNVAVLSPDDTVGDAVRLMREHDVRRLPVMVDGQPIGMVSLGDLPAVEGAAGSVLADLSAAPPDSSR